MTIVSDDSGEKRAETAKADDTMPDWGFDDEAFERTLVTQGLGEQRPGPLRVKSEAELRELWNNDRGSWEAYWSSVWARVGQSKSTPWPTPIDADTALQAGLTDRKVICAQRDHDGATYELWRRTTVSENGVPNTRACFAVLRDGKRHRLSVFVLDVVYKGARDRFPRVLFKAKDKDAIKAIPVLGALIETAGVLPPSKGSDVLFYRLAAAMRGDRVKGLECDHLNDNSLIDFAFGPGEYHRFNNIETVTSEEHQRRDGRLRSTTNGPAMNRDGDVEEG